MKAEKSITVYLPEDFKQEVLEQQQQNRILFIHGGAGTGKTCLSRILVETLKKEANLMYVPLKQMKTYDAVVKVLTPVLNLEAKQKAVLVLDDIDSLLDIEDGEGFFRFEREVLLPIVEEEKVNVIATSSLNIRTWREYEVRDCVHSMAIPSLGADALRDWAEKIGVSFEKAMQWTLGYPQMMAWLEQDSDIARQELLAQFVERNLKDITEDQKDFVLEVSLFPMFNIDLLEKCLGREDMSYGDFVESLRLMIDIGLITWNSEIGAYTFEDARIRRFFSETLQLQLPDKFKALNNKAKEEFEEETRYVSYLDYSLPGYIYHASVCAGLRSNKNWSVWDENEKVGNEIVQWINDRLPDWQGADWKKIRKIWLQEDEGDQEFVKELKHILSETAFVKIAAMFSEAI